jgi:pimeloyl-ACP methyl ester carboxylesterase
MRTGVSVNYFWSIVLVIAGSYGALVIFLYFSQSRLLYLPNLPSRDIVATPDMVGLDYEPVKIVSDDGVTLDGWFVPVRQMRGVLLFFHGNAGNISHRLDSLKVFYDLGLATFIFDYRGYGRSTGAPSEQGTYRDATAVWRYLTEDRRIAAKDIVLFGRSLGAAIAVQLAPRWSQRWVSRKQARLYGRLGYLYESPSRTMSGSTSESTTDKYLGPSSV